MIRCTPTNGAPSFIAESYQEYMVFDLECQRWRVQGLVADVVEEGKVVLKYVETFMGAVMCRIEWIRKEET